jgi:hypothetical protein
MRSPVSSPLGSLALVAAGCVLFGTSSLQAFASNRNGNPFGNGTFFQNNGTFSAVIRGTNLSGTMLFSTGYSQSTNSGASNNSSGSCVISYLGSDDGSTAPGVYNGNAAGMWDPSAGTISGQFWGSYQMSGSNSSTNWSEMYNTNSFPVPINIVSNVVIPPTAGSISNGIVIPGAPGTNYTVTNVLYIEPIGSNNFNNSAMMNGSFDGNLQNKYPNQTFSAQGQIMQQQLFPPQQGVGASNTIYDPNTGGSSVVYNQEGTLPVQMAAPLAINISVTGLRISDAYSTFNTVSNNVPWAFTTYSLTNIPSKSGGLGN